MSSRSRILAAFAATLLITSLVTIDSTSAAADEDQPLYFSLIVSSDPTLNTSGIVTAVDETLELIRNDTTILPGYSLQYSQVLDSQCNSSRVLEIFDAEINSNKSLVAVVGCGCSTATDAVASISDIPVISYASTSVALSNNSVYPNLFRTIPSDESLAPALTTVMQYYGWKQLSIITEKESQFTELLKLVNDSLQNESISVENSVLFSPGNLSDASDIIFAGSSRIIYLNTNPKSALFYLCRAFQEEKYYPGYVWITPGWYQREWWKSDGDYLTSLNCTSSDIEQQLNRSLVLLTHPSTTSLNISEQFNYDSYAIDAVMALALALNETYYNNSLTNLSLQRALEEVMFSGASGSVEFGENGDRLNPLVYLQQFRMDSIGSTVLYTIGTVEENTVMYVSGETNSTVWPDVRGQIPPVIIVINVVKTGVYAYVVTLVTIGIALALACFVFNIIFRKKKVVKLTSPNLNYVIVFGAILLQIGNLFLPFPSRNITLIAVFCTMARIFLSIGYDICFVVALVKTIRVAYIFKNVTPNKKKVKDWHLMLLAVGIVMIEVIFTIPLLTLTYVKGDTRMARDSESPTFINDQGYTVTHLILSCGLSTIYIIYFSLALVYKVIIHVIGLVLAFITRKVKIDTLNDSKYSAAIIYCSCFMLILAVVVIFALSGVNTYAAVWTTFVFVEVCVFLGLTFIPKMVSLYRDPLGERIFDGPRSQSQSYNLKSISTTTTEVGKSELFAATETLSKKSL